METIITLLGISALVATPVSAAELERVRVQGSNHRLESRITTVNNKPSENARRVKFAKKTIGMTDNIVAAMVSYYGEKPEGLLGDFNYCRKDGYCSIIKHPYSIRVYGAGIAEVVTSTRRSFADYMELCAITFSALSGSSVQFSMEAMAGAFGNASQNGGFKHDLSGVQIKVSPGSDNILSCRFFKYGQ